MPHEIRSANRVYPVGQRGSYVYHLLVHYRDRAERDNALAGYARRFELTPEEVGDLERSLAELDGRRAGPRKPVRATDPYWSLWVSIRAIEEGEAMEMGGGIHYRLALAELDELRLPLTGLHVSISEGDGGFRVGVSNGRKEIVNAVQLASHGVNFLKKIDRDWAYRVGCGLPEPEPVSVWSEEGQAVVYSGRDGWAVVRGEMVDGSRDQGGRFGVLDEERRLIYACRESSDGTLTYVDADGETHTLAEAGCADVIIG